MNSELSGIAKKKSSEKNGAGAISDNSIEQSRVMSGERYGTTIWLEAD